MTQQIILCACGCGCEEEIIIKPHHKYYGIPIYKHGHNTIINNPMNNLESVKKSAKSRTGSKRTTEVKIKKSEQMKRFHKDNPEMGIKQSEMMKATPPMANPNTVRKQSKSMKYSKANKINSDKQRGGNDIVKHHLIYDHSDLSKFTIPITRSAHAMIHAAYREHDVQMLHLI